MGKIYQCGKYWILVIQQNLSRMTQRIRSVPGNSVLPVNSSAIIHPTDQMSTKIYIYIYIYIVL